MIACACDPGLFEKTLSNLVEAKSRGAYSVLVCDETFEVPDGVADFTVRLPHTDPLLSPLVTVVFLQCIAYKTAVLRGADVDRPRNLAKSVTVE